MTPHHDSGPGPHTPGDSGPGPRAESNVGTDAETGPGFDAAGILRQLDEATDRLCESASRLGDDDMRAPSLLPDWTRGHVMTHLARNADGGTRLLTWARTGVERAEYADMAARAEEIAAGAGRTASELLADVRGSAGRFAAEYRRLTPGAWRRVVRWTGGQEHPALRVADSRLAEVLIHHVDLDAGYRPADWPPDFTAELLPRVAAALAARPDPPAARLLDRDTGQRWEFPGRPGTDGDTAGVPLVEGSTAALLGWLLGRSAGAGLTTSGRLPALPPVY